MKFLYLSCWYNLTGFVKVIKGQINPRQDVYSFYDVGLAIGHYILPSFLAVRLLFGITFFIALLIYKWRKRHLSTYECIELYLQQENNLMPIRYSYKEIKKMAKGFKTSWEKEVLALYLRGTYEAALVWQSIGVCMVGYFDRPNHIHI